MSVTTADNAPPVLMDQQLMRQVILNLVSNAVNYTHPNGEVTIEIAWEGPTCVGRFMTAASASQKKPCRGSLRSFIGRKTP
jgi:signal transduction histidine kinase